MTQISWGYWAEFAEAITAGTPAARREVLEKVHFELEDVIDVGDDATVVSVQRTQGRTRHMNVDTNLRWAAVWTFEGEHAVRARGYLRKEEALEAAGLRE